MCFSTKLSRLIATGPAQAGMHRRKMGSGREKARRREGELEQQENLKVEGQYTREGQQKGRVGPATWSNEIKQNHKRIFHLDNVQITLSETNVNQLRLERSSRIAMGRRDQGRRRGIFWRKQQGNRRQARYRNLRMPARLVGVIITVAAEAMVHVGSVTVEVVKTGAGK